MTSDEMTALSNDTSPDVKRVQIEHLREMPPWRKLALMAEMGQTVRALALSGLRQRYPDDTPAQRRRRLADLLLGEELAARVYGTSIEDFDRAQSEASSEGLTEVHAQASTPEEEPC